MANLVDYTEVNWKDFPNTDTPVTATNLSIMDNGIKNNATAINKLNSNKADKATTLSGYGITNSFAYKYITSGDLNSIGQCIGWVNGWNAITNNPFTNTHSIIISDGRNQIIANPSGQIRLRHSDDGSSWNSWNYPFAEKTLTYTFTGNYSTFNITSDVGATAKILHADIYATDNTECCAYYAIQYAGDQIYLRMYQANGSYATSEHTIHLIYIN